MPGPRPWWRELWQWLAVTPSSVSALPGFLPLDLLTRPRPVSGLTATAQPHAHQAWGLCSRTGRTPQRLAWPGLGPASLPAPRCGQLSMSRCCRRGSRPRSLRGQPRFPRVHSGCPSPPFPLSGRAGWAGVGSPGVGAGGGPDRHSPRPLRRTGCSSWNAWASPWSRPWWLSQPQAVWRVRCHCWSAARWALRPW